MKIILGIQKKIDEKAQTAKFTIFAREKLLLQHPVVCENLGNIKSHIFSTSERCSKKSFPHAKIKNLAIWAFSSICLYSQYYFHPIGPHCIKIFTVLGLCPLVTFARQNVDWSETQYPKHTTKARRYIHIFKTYWRMSSCTAHDPKWRTISCAVEFWMV